MVQVSVIVPTHNRLGYLRECLASVEAQTCPPFEIIVVDDGSADGTVEWLQDTRPEVRVILQENLGPGAARNRGAAEARGEYLAFLDSDDLWFPWSLQVIDNLIACHGGPSLLFASFEDFAGVVAPAAAEAAPKASEFKDFLASAPEGCFAGAGMMTVRRDTFLLVGGFENMRMNAEDHDLALRLGTAPRFVQVREPLLVAHRVHEGNLMSDAARNIEGLMRLVAREKSGSYPGGKSRKSERRRIVSRHVRAALLSGDNCGALGLAAALYRQTFFWNLGERRFRYLAAAPFFALRAALRRESEAAI